MTTARTWKLPTVQGWVLVLLAISGFVLIYASSLTFQIEWVPVVQLGLYSLLPIGYWVGIGVIIVSLALGLKSGREGVFVFQGLLLYLAIWGAPVMYLHLPDVWDSYTHFFSSMTIANDGSIWAQGIFSYSANYPGLFVIGSTFFLVADPNVLQFLQLWPLFVSSLTLLSLYLFVRTYLPGWDHRFAFLISCFGNVWVQYNYSPQSLGLVVGLLVFVFLEKEGFRWLLLALAAFIYVVISHPTTTFFVVAGLIFREVVVVIKNRREKGEKRERSWPIFAFLIIWIGWLFTGAREYSGFLWETIYRRIAFIFLITEKTQQAVGQRTEGNIFGLAPYLRLALLGVLMLFLLLAILNWLRSHRRRDLPGSLLALAFVPIIVIPLDLLLLQGSVYDRGFLYFALSAPILITLMYFRRWTPWRKIAAALIVVAAVMCCASAFYQESLYVVSDRSMEMTNFLDEHVAIGSYIVGGYYPDLVWRESNWTQFTKQKYYEPYNESFGNVTELQGATGMIFDRTSELWATQFGQLHVYNFYRNNMSYYSKVYENGAYQMIYGGTVLG
ncbi:MAG TPA: hypothetical protein VLU38_07595 [Methanomassiliicoccales archaeon]|nr:hypothetical protein [Methanomassiliicoccales archaeon]